jgi:hypothetical protein
MDRSSSSITAAANLVRGEIVAPPNGVDQHLRVEFSVKASDLEALLSEAEKTALSTPGASIRLLFSATVTDDAGNSLGVGQSGGGSSSAYPHAANASEVGLTTAQQFGLAAYLKAN